ncbi:TetR family transcriptional regulator [Pseudactinotalea sp. HY160]|uniref:TetR/AcrR family transcriptional regulator n=1 Tax=Pseudactinotalea sp. HY160 TaxID=2654490 RepID=UPI00128CA28C|nr:TetR/AcrR family transcriptional regulator [Pseudactinotalea sp. HY160]MPV49681.1 TetR family transcriptional regulator [Pseudactinotalea sp. HY160]
MRQRQRAGRPRASSREILEEAACELFLEQGYAATSVADITARAGVSRATFFNYVPTKSDLLWTSIDEAFESLAAELEGAGLDGTDPEGTELGSTGVGGTGLEGTGLDGAAAQDDRSAGPAPSVRPAPSPREETAAALLHLAERLTPGTVVLAFANAEPMGVAAELEESAALRQQRLARILAGRLRRRGMDALEADVVGAAQAGALLAALRAWSRGAPGRTSFPAILTRALSAIAAR